MSLKRALLAAAYPALEVRDRVLSPLTGRAARLRVLLYHDISPWQEERFEAQMRWLQRHWDFVDASRFSALMNGDETLCRDSLLLTFDDGFSSNRRVAEQVLNPMAIKALFFTVSEFVGIDDRERSREFIARHIYPKMHADSLPEHWGNMGWSDLECLLDQRHSIGAHTATHARLSSVADDSLSAEIADSADKLERRLGVQVDHFAFTFGDLRSFSAAALAVARRRFNYVYTGLRGGNGVSVPPWAIRRDSLSVDDSRWLVGAFLRGAADRRYAPSLASYQSWG